MRFVFLSNFFNHHQVGVSRKLYAILNGKYSFIETKPMDDDRVILGYECFKDEYIDNYYQHKEKCDSLINKADVILLGSAPQSLIMTKLKGGSLVFFYTERIYKFPPKWYETPVRAIKYWYQKGRYQNMYLLCSSAYTAADYHRTRTFENRAYKWGYFPEMRKYDIDLLLEKKQKTNILWVGRFLEWKHPDDVLRIAKKLKEAGYAFEIQIGGAGEMEQQLKQMVKELQIEDCVGFLGAIPSYNVRSYMESAGIYLFTSDRQEGWGAVLNEAMNSGCAVVASHAIGSVPYLLKHNENGLVYHSGNVEELYERLTYLLDNPKEQERLGKAAYETIVCEWNAEVAAERLVNLSEHLLLGEKYPDLYKTGPCSRAGILVDDWFNG